jgi:RNAse (barnase) inhibitor barstar
VHNQDTWDLFANHHELPMTLRWSHDPKKPTLLMVCHEIVVYLITKDPSKEILTMTEPIPV